MEIEGPLRSKLRKTSPREGSGLCPQLLGGDLWTLAVSCLMGLWPLGVVHVVHGGFGDMP